MSLKGFHLVFISASVLLAFLLAFWCFTAGPQPSGSARTAAGVLSGAAGLGLCAYQAWFVRKMRRLP